MDLNNHSKSNQEGKPSVKKVVLIRYHLKAKCLQSVQALIVLKKILNLFEILRRDFE
ncbi:hypothetical protein EW15_0154 [Prochlorococcus sp. MIT 0801]|nr:hypothetical protein EW15_0154 [Prochlorococcus sp. MIT 0801]